MKLSKSAVDFEHPAKGPNHCSQCRHFLPDQLACRIVAGHITGRDWCKRFLDKDKDREAKAERHYADI
jgi:hypothetical protein